MKGLGYTRSHWLLVGVLVLIGVLIVVYPLPQNTASRQMPKIAASRTHLLAVKSDGSLWAMGRNTSGQIGDGTTNDHPSLVRIGSGNDWADVACGYEFSLALKTDGSLWAWGDNKGGQLGDGTTKPSFSPLRIGQEKGWAAIAAKIARSFGVKSDGSLWTWGLEVNRPHLWSYAGDFSPGWKSISSCDIGLSLLLKTDGTLWKSSTDRGVGVPFPAQIGNDRNWVCASTGWEHYLGVKTDGSLWEWGDVPDHSDRKVTVLVDLPRRIENGTGWKLAAAGMSHSIALKNDGTLWTWGFNGSGQLGNGTCTTNGAVIAPNQLGKAHDWIWVGAGPRYSVGLKADGSLWMWGERIGGEGQPMAWLRKKVASLGIPFRLPPPRAIDLVPHKIANLGPLPEPAHAP
jgi:hypothetical protein